MNKFINYFNDALIVFGSIFVILLVISFFFPIFEYVDKQKMYLLVLFIALFLGKMYLSQKK